MGRRTATSRKPSAQPRAARSATGLRADPRRALRGASHQGPWSLRGRRRTVRGRIGHERGRQDRVDDSHDGRPHDRPSRRHGPRWGDVPRHRESRRHNQEQRDRPRDYEPTQGARFEVHLTKARGVYGADAEPYEAALATNEDGKTVWTIRTMDDRMTAQVADMVRDGETYRDIAKAVGTTKSSEIGHGTTSRPKARASRCISPRPVESTGPTPNRTRPHWPRTRTARPCGRFARWTTA